MSDNVNYSEKYNAKYSEQYDAYYVADTGEWLEETCDEPECEYCANRPENALKDAP